MYQPNPDFREPQLENSVEANMILDLVSDYATGELEAQKRDLFLT
jgi:hypothetical protein